MPGLFPDDPNAVTGNAMLSGAAAPSLFPESSVMRSSSDREINRLPPAQDATPDTAARVIKLQTRTGLPADLISRNLDQIEAQASARDFDAAKFRRESPMLSQWLEANPQHGALAKDDLANLGLLEWIVTAPQRAFKRGQAQVEFGNLSSASIFRDLTADENKRMQELRAQSQAGGDLAAEAWFAKALTGGAEQLPMLWGGLTAGAKTGVPTAFGAASAALIAGQLGPQVALPEEVLTVPAAAAIGFRVGSTAGAARFTFHQEAGQAFDEFSKFKDELGRPLDRDVARAAAVAAGAINAGLEVYQLHTLMRSIPGVEKLYGATTRGAIARALEAPSVRGALKELMLGYGKTLTAETATEIAQRAVTIMSGEIGKVTSGQSIPLRSASDIGADLASEGVQALQAFTFIAAPGHVAGFGRDMFRAREAAKNTEFFNALGEGVNQSETFKRMPEKLREFIASATADGPIENVYVDPATWAQYWQSKNLDPEAVAEQVLGEVTPYNEALRQGHDLAIPLADYASKLAPTEHNAFFANELRLGPDEMNAREAVEFEQRMQAEAEAAKSAQADQTAMPVREDIIGQLMASGMDRATAETNAAGVEAAFNSLRERAGPKLFDKVAGPLFEKLRIRRPMPDVLSKLGNVNELDALLDRLRRGEVPSGKDMFGESLGDFIRKNGGIRDEGGELKARDIGVQEKGRKRDQRIMREDGKSFDHMREAAVEAGYLPADADINDFITALDNEIGGTPVYAAGRENAKAMELAQQVEALDRYMKERGLDLNSLTNEQIKAELDKVMNDTGATPGVTFEQGRRAQTPIPSGQNTIEIDGVERSVMNSDGRPIATSVEAITAFWRWFGNSKIVDDQGRPKVVYHGSRRLDRVGPKLNPKRATSGPMPYFTESTELASNYAKNKADTSLMKEDVLNYEHWFRVKIEGYRNPVNLDLAWYSLGQEERARIASLAPRVSRNDEGEIILEPEGHKTGIGGYDYAIQQARGNHFAALIDQWLQGATLYNDEEEFLKVLKLAGMTTPVEMHDPHAEFPGVLPVYLSIQNPLATATISDGVIARLAQAVKRTRGKTLKDTGNMWDKDRQSPKEWVEQLRGDIADGKNSYVWTSIPDRITQELRTLGYDGIVDAGGKGGSEHHTVYIPFRPEDVKSAIGNRGTFDPTSGNILNQEQRGAIRFGQDRQFNIDLLAKADLSTFIHETGHFYLEVLGDLVDEIRAKDTAPPARVGNPFVDGPAMAEWRRATSERLAANKDAAEFSSADGQRRALASADASKPGAFRMTRFADGEPVGHIDAPTLAKAIEYALEEGFDPPSTLTDQQRRMLDDYAAVLKWMNVESRDKITVEQHEQWARGIEAYIMEGKAPSAALRAVFARFRAWLVSIYRSFKALNVELTPEVRAVMDRLFATDEEIAHAEREADIAALFSTAEKAGMSEAEFAAYRDDVQAASDSARDRLHAKIMRQMQRERETWWKAERAKVRDEVALEVYDRQEYIALANLQRGTAPNGAAVQNAIKLDRASLVEAYGTEFLKRLPRPYVYKAEGGVSQDVAAEMFGYDSGDALVQALANARPMKQLIEAETDQRMRERYGDMMLDGTIADEARAAVQNEERSKVIHAEMLALAKKRREVAKYVDPIKGEVKEAKDEASRVERERAYERRWLEAERRLAVSIERGARQEEIDRLQSELSAIKADTRSGAAMLRASVPALPVVRAMSAGRISLMRVRDIQPMVYWNAARKAGAQAVDLAARDDFDGALMAKQRELLNVELYRAAVNAREDADAIVDYMRTFTQPAKRQRLGKAGGDYLEQIDAILERFDFSRISNKAVDRRKSLALWVADQERQGLPVNLPEELLDESRRMSFKDMTYEQLIGVRDGVRHIEHLARLKNKLLGKQRQRELDQAADEVSASVRAHVKKPKGKVLERLPKDEALREVDKWFASNRKLSSLARQFDGFQDGGAMWEYFIRPLNESGDRETVMNAHAAEKLYDIFQAYKGKEVAALYRKTFIPEVGASLSKMGRLVIAFNWGNTDSRQKLMDGGLDGKTKLAQSQIEAILDGLDHRDWKFVQGVWDFINSYWPEIEALEKRTTGVAPKKVEAAAVQTKFGEFAGGYFPAKYDERKSPKVYGQRAEEVGKQMMAGGQIRASVSRGFTKERVEGVELPMRLDFGVIFEHVQTVIHYLSHRETLLDVNRLLRQAAVADAITESYGDVAYDQFRKMFEDVAAGDVPAVEAWEKVINHLRTGTTIVGLGWNVATAMLQPFGLTQSMVRVGPTWVARGISRWMHDLNGTVEWINAKSPMMAGRSKTQLREINEIRNQSGLKTGRFQGWIDETLSAVTADTVTRQGIVDSFFWMIYKGQQVADIPTWLGAYEKAMHNGSEEGDAIAIADQAVLDSQGGGQIKDLARIQRGGPLLKLWTNFFSYFNVTYNLNVESVRRTNFRNPIAIGRLAVDFLLLNTLPALLPWMLIHALRGDSNDDYLKKLLQQHLGYMIGQMVGLREFGSAIQGFQGYEGPAGARFFSSASKFIVQASQMELDAAFWKALNESAGAFLHYPAAQVSRTVEGFDAMHEGRTKNPLVLLLGAPKE